MQPKKDSLIHKQIIHCLFALILLFTATITKAQSPPGDVVGKVTVGYQGWFAAPGDSSPYNNWWHWTTDGRIPSPPPKPDSIQLSNSGIKAWPDMRELANGFATAFAGLGNGRPANLFSSYPDQTIATQFMWMQIHGIDCAALQRFDPNGSEGPIRDSMAAKVSRAAVAHNVKFYIMYDVSGWFNMATEMEADWLAKMSAYTSSPAYAHQNGKPVVCIWGLGLNDANHPFSNDTCVSVINWFKAQGCYVIGGVRGEWRTIDPTYMPTYNALNMISPWEIGKIGSLADEANYYTNINIPDEAYCKANGIDYQPCILPGDLSLHQRLHGNFMWSQFYNMAQLGAQGLYISMFDEFNEGNQIAETAENQSQVPVNSGYLGLNEDGTALSSDYYMRLTNDGAKMFKGQIALTSTSPTPYFLTAAPAITNLATASGIAGTYLTYNIAASGAPVSFNATGLPVGLSVDTSTGIISGIPTTAGNYIITLTAKNANGAGALSVTFTIAAPAPESAYGGTPWPVPGIIQAENYDIGGQGVAYNDDDSANLGGQYRLTEGVDIENCSDVGGGYDVGFTNAGEWLKYTVNVEATGTYVFQARMATPDSGNTFHVEVDGYNISGSVAVPVSGGWQTWETVSFTTPVITKGLHVIRFYEETGGYNINYYNIVRLAVCPNTTIPLIGTTSPQAGNVYQWQINSGSGYTNINNSLIYTGATSDTLILNNAPTSLYGNSYRCAITNNSLVSYNAPYTLQFGVTWTGAINTAWENAANWSCGIVPDSNTDVIINSVVNSPIVNSNTSCRSLTTNTGSSVIISSGNHLTITH